MESLGQLEGQLLVVWDVTGSIDVWNQISLLNVERKDLTSSIDDDHAISVGIPG